MLGVAACGGDDGGEPAAVAIESAPTGDGQFELTVPESVEAGLVRLEFQNGTEEDAEAQLAAPRRRPYGRRGAGGDRLRGREDPDWLHAEGGVGMIAAGRSGAVELVLEEGTYHVIDTGEPEGDDVQSHAESGATAMLEVSEGDDDAELPEVDASIEMADFEFVTDGLKAGTNRFLLENTGEELHHTLVVPINEGATFAAGQGVHDLGGRRPTVHRRSTSRSSRGRRCSTAAASRSTSWSSPPVGTRSSASSPIGRAGRRTSR